MSQASMFPASSNMKLVLVATILLVVTYEAEGFEGNHYQQILESRGSRLQNRFIGTALDKFFGFGRNEPADNTNAYVIISPHTDQHIETVPDRSRYPGNFYDDNYYYGGENRYRHPHYSPDHKQGPPQVVYTPPKQDSRDAYQKGYQDAYQQAHHQHGPRDDHQQGLRDSNQQGPPNTYKHEPPKAQEKGSPGANQNQPQGDNKNKASEGHTSGQLALKKDN